MSFILSFLATYHSITNYISEKRAEIASWLRSTLGPEPQNWILLNDGRIIPSTVTLTSPVQAVSYMYNIHTFCLTKMDIISPGRYRPLSILALRFQHPDVGSIDISDWLGDIRIFPQRNVTPRELIELWGATHNQYAPVKNVEAVVTRNDGTIETIMLE